MKPEQLNRLMRVNKCMQPWFLRSTNELYENAVRTYYARSSSVLPYNPDSRDTKGRQENPGPVRILKTAERERCGQIGGTYPRTHKQMADQASVANSSNLIETVMQASRRRSMSFSMGAARNYNIYGDSLQSASSSSYSSGMGSVANHLRPKSNDNDDGDMTLFSGRSMSLPPRPPQSALKLGMVGFVKQNPPSRLHHMNALEKSTKVAAKATAAARRNSNNVAEAERLMVIDKALKQRLAVRFDQDNRDESDANTGERRFRFGLGLDLNTKKQHAMGEMRDPSTRFQKLGLGERIKRFERIQFSDGPVTNYAFNRHTGDIKPYHSAQYAQRRQLGFKNVLYTNHRQRNNCNYSTITSMSRELIISPPPLKPLAPMTIRRTQHQQRSLTDGQQNNEEPEGQQKQKKEKRKKQENSETATTSKSKTKVKNMSTSFDAYQNAIDKNKMSRICHQSYIQDKSLRPCPLPALLMKRARKQQQQREQQQHQHENQTPSAPLKLGNQTLVASASQVSAFKPSFRSQHQTIREQSLKHYEEQQAKLIAEQPFGKAGSNSNAHRRKLATASKMTLKGPLIVMATDAATAVKRTCNRPGILSTARKYFPTTNTNLPMAVTATPTLATAIPTPAAGAAITASCPGNAKKNHHQHSRHEQQQINADSSKKHQNLSTATASVAATVSPATIYKPDSASRMLTTPYHPQKRDPVKGAHMEVQQQHQQKQHYHHEYHEQQQQRKQQQQLYQLHQQQQHIQNQRRQFHYQCPWRPSY
ncbi:putative uncharacterized protein DDB_G0268364 [Drosophila tropicalis]|uniref:putative uncharacterized protein DDB_G0268364 n=1 Tax=Drosophila tropicalis TaxID=46794 RepID=UPI0035ABBCFC